MSATGITYGYRKSFIFEYGHVAYQVKGNETYNNMLANSMVLPLPLTTGVGSKG